MLQEIIRFDIDLFLFLNSLNSPFWDQIMFLFSSTKFWLPLYAVILFFLFKKKKHTGFLTLVFIALVVIFADQGSVHLFKEVFERLRPCKTPELKEIVHLVNGKCGGKYGFISSHAANTFAVAMFTARFFSNKYFSLFIFFWATIVSYSRIYLGVHFPADVFGGAIFGILIACFVFFLYSKAENALTIYFAKK